MTKRQFLSQLSGFAALSAVGARSPLLPELAAQTARKPGPPGPNAIARVTAVSVNIPCEYQVGSFKRNVRMGGVVAQVETADGLIGHGFSSITNNEVVVSAIRDVIAPAIKGKDAMSREAISDELYWLLTPRGQTGHAVHAISAIDCALWDIAGKRYNEPVWRLLGGARSEVRTYTTCGMNFLTRDELAQVARDVVKSGQRKIKMVVAADATDVDKTGKSLYDILDEDAARIKAVREAVGSGAEIYIDANHALDEYHVRRFAKQIAPYDIGFFEEPLRANDIRRLADLRKEIGIPIAAGQNEGHISRWRDMVVNDAVDVLQMNVCIGGGFSAGLKVAALGAAFGVPIDNGGGYANFNMHLHGGVANGGMSEWHLNAVGYCRVLYKGIPELVGDKLTLPTRPGLGFELNPDAMRDFAAKG